MKGVYFDAFPFNGCKTDLFLNEIHHFIKIFFLYIFCGEGGFKPWKYQEVPIDLVVIGLSATDMSLRGWQSEMQVKWNLNRRR